jgi:catechol 2,3-dioxygenase-like lactoylglutathione lyase family enzyme
MHLYETHLPVADTKAAEKFYREIVGLPFAYRDPRRDIVFLWADAEERGMIGLWGSYPRPSREFLRQILSGHALRPG